MYIHAVTVNEIRCHVYFGSARMDIRGFGETGKVMEKQLYYNL